MTSRTAAQAAPTYAPARSKTEQERLTRQAALLEAMTERLPREAGMKPGMRVLDAARQRAELLGLRNVAVVEGNIRSSDDPGAALLAVAERLRPGGVLAFQELDLDSGVHARSLPEGTLWDGTGRRVSETFARAGTQLRVDRGAVVWSPPLVGAWTRKPTPTHGERPR